MECEYPPLLVRAAGSQLSVFRSRQLTSDYVLSAAVRFRFLFPAFSRRSRRVFLSALSSAVFIAERLSVKRSISRSRFSRLARNKSVQRGLLISATLVSSRNDPPVKYFVSSFREVLFISAAARTCRRCGGRVLPV